MTTKEYHAGRSYYDDFSGWYENQRHHGYHQVIDALEVDLSMPLCAGKDILEAGCGTGLILQELAKVAKTTTGLDLSLGMARQAKTKGLPVVLGSITDLPFAAESFDVVLSFKVLAHLQNIERALQEIARVTRPGGHVVLEFYNSQSLRYWAKRLAGPGKISAARVEAEMFTRWESPEKITERFSSQFTVISTHGVRVLTPAAFVHKLPLLGPLWGKAERIVRDGPLARFGGFFVVVAQKK
jgi:ubiquinone/menaquinone biosynthesis C-methylase UbiE